MPIIQDIRGIQGITEDLSRHHDGQYILRHEGVVDAHSFAIVLAPIRYLHPCTASPSVVGAQGVEPWGEEGWRGVVVGEGVGERRKEKGGEEGWKW